MRLASQTGAARPPVVITGIGAVTPLGNGFDTVADALLAGRSGVRSIDPGPFARESRQFAAVVERIPPPAGTSTVDAEAFAGLARYEQLCASCVAHAIADAGLAADAPRLRIGLVLGLGAEHLKTWEFDYLHGGTQVLQPTDDDTLVHRVAGIMHLHGPAVTVAAACASSGYALALGRNWVAAGWVDACVVGGCDVLSPTAVAAFYNLRALSRRSDDPAKASRPFDRGRDGFVMGEGGACLVLERLETARQRGGRVRGELAGVGMSSDAAHMVTPCSDPTQAARAIARALADAAVAPEQLDYINAHAAGTPVGDAAEAAAIRLALGAAADHVPVSSTKSMSGHLISGAAGFEAVACLAALHRQSVPPTLNLDDPDPACALDHVPHTARARPVRITASNSFGFGGANLCLVIRHAA